MMSEGAKKASHGRQAMFYDLLAAWTNTIGMDSRIVEIHVPWNKNDANWLRYEFEPLGVSLNKPLRHTQRGKCTADNDRRENDSKELKFEKNKNFNDLAMG